MIRSATNSDLTQIDDMLVAAFGGQAEKTLVRLLRQDAAFISELVAEVDDRVVGGILFSRLDVRVDGHPVKAAALAPVAVFPSFQYRGIGSLLIESGLADLRRTGYEAVIVVGRPAYYARFGFSHEGVRHLESEYQSEAFMGLELLPAALTGSAGRVEYPKAFQQLGE